MEIFSKGVNPWVWSTIEIFSFLPFKQNRLWNNVSWPSVSKTSLARLKNKDFAKTPYGDFFKGVNPWFWWKIRIFFLFFLLNKIGLEIMFPDHPVRKQAYLDLKMRSLPSRPMEIFSKGVNPWVWSTIGIFLLCFLLNKVGLEIMFADHPVRKQAYLD